MNNSVMQTEMVIKEPYVRYLKLEIQILNRYLNSRVDIDEVFDSDTSSERNKYMGLIINIEEYYTHTE